MKFSFFLIPLFSCFILSAQNNINIVPMPVEIKTGKGHFLINENTTLFLEGSNLENSAAFLIDYLQDKYGFTLKKGNSKSGKNTITLNFERLDYPIPGAYNLEVNDKEINIAGDNEAGVFYGIQTLIQLLPTSIEKAAYPADNKKSITIPAVFISDHPRFAYRGMHLDVSRHFFSVEAIKQYLNYLAYYKFNNFHWHLTDDQGWRIEIKKYPKLTETGSCRAQTLSGRFGSDKYDGIKYCGYYSQEEIKEIVKYASDRYINIIPEIDIPGHSGAALASYPFLGCTKGPYKVMETWGVSSDVLCAGNDSTYAFIQDVLDEVMQLFPSTYIHIGGDECPKEKWKNCRICQQKIKENNLKNEHELQGFFIQSIEKFVNSRGKKIIGWDEILEGGLAPNATVMSWRGEAGGIAAARQKHFVIMTPENPLYLNHQQSKNDDSVTQGGYNPIENVYQYEPIPKELNEEQGKFILGAQGNVWSEYIDNEKKLTYMIFPRMSALAEVLWSPKEKRNWKDFENRLPGIMDRYKLWDVNFSTAYYDLQAAVLADGENGVSWKLVTKNKSGKIIYVKDSTTNASYEYAAPINIATSGLYGAALTDANNKIISNWIWQQFYFNKATGKKISLVTEPNKSYSTGGAFALVDGVQNEKGMLRSAQFLGFNGKDLEAVVDLGSITEINAVVLHAFEQKGSWIYRPSTVLFYTSNDGVNFMLIDSLINIDGVKNLLYKSGFNQKARFIKIIAKNNGVIASGEPGAGNNSWLFVDEIEVK